MPNGTKYAQTYAYNKRNELIERTRQLDTQPPRTHKYRFDKSGNRTRWTHDFATQKTTIQPDSDQLQSVWETEKKGDAGWYDYQYDENGNRTNKIARNNKKEIWRLTYNWDTRNRLKSVKYNEKTLQTNKYALDGLRYEKHLPTPLEPTQWETKTKGPTTIQYVYDSAQKLLTEKQPAQTHSYIYWGAQKLGKVTTTKDGKEQAYWYHNDPLGTPITISWIEGDGTIGHNRYYLDPWGNTELTKQSRGHEQAVQYTGKFVDFEIGKKYFHDRYQDGENARFLGKDRASADFENPLSLNRFQYVFNRPLVAVDPDGLETLFVKGIGKYRYAGPTREMGQNVNADNYQLSYGAGGGELNGRAIDALSVPFFSLSFLSS